MKRSFMVLLVTFLIVSGCMKDTVTDKYTFYRPIYWTRDEVKASIKSSAPVAIEQTGKIVVRGNYVFLNEIDRGVHVINIADPAQPVNTAFIPIPGCIDIAVNGNYMYADCYTNLATIDITDPANVVLTQFQDDVFSPRYYTGYTASKMLLIKDWEKVDTTVSKTFTAKFGPGGNVAFLYSSAFASSLSYSSSGIGIAGSMARFALQNSRLYTVSTSTLKVFNVASPSLPAFVSNVALGQGNIETIFPYKDKLFIGASAGMYIYNASNPDLPKQYSQFTHARSCDPVIADDNFAYVTLSGGSACGGYSNQLDVVDISNLVAPKLVKSYTLTGPKGLSKDGNILMICDGKDGLKFFDASNVTQVTQLKTVTGFEPTDVIALQGISIAIAVAKDGLYFIDYSNPAAASIKSKLQIQKKS